jgi:hypothetical protein
MLGALCYGLPQLCLPQGTDQPSNTAALLPTGAAVAPHPDEITSDAVAEALGRLLNEPSFRQAANRLRAEIERMPAAGAVLHEFLATTDPVTAIRRQPRQLSTLAMSVLDRRGCVECGDKPRLGLPALAGRWRCQRGQRQLQDL